MKKEEVYEPSQEPFDNKEIDELINKAHKDPEVIENWKKYNEIKEKKS